MRYIVALLALVAVAAAQLPDNAADLPIAQLLNIANAALTSGKSASALTIYDYCLERDPSDFATLYKRATVRLATGQWGKAKEGFHEVLAVKEWDQAHLQLAKLHAKLGEFDQAKKEVDTFLEMSKGSDSKEVTEARALRKQILNAQKELVAARKALKAKSPKLDTCLASASSAITVAPNSEELRLLRAECYLLAREWDSTIGDLSRASALSPSLPPHLLLRLSLVSSLFLDNGREIPADALLPVKRCLSSDPDSKPCRGAFKSLKALEKELAKLRNWVDGARWTEAAVVLAGSSKSEGVIKTVKSLISQYQQPLPTSPDAPAPLPTDADLPDLSPLLGRVSSDLCRAYISLGQTRKASAACEEALRINPEDVWGLVGRADKLMADEEWEEAVRALTSAFEATGRSDRDILGRLQKAQRLLKQSTAKDYYKVLGVSRDADAKTIKRAYRKGTLKAHPDKEGGSEEKMAALNEAYEVLSNPELRERFDNGEDPNDPHSQNQGHPFQQGGNPFGGGHPFQGFFQQGGFPGGGFQQGHTQFRWG
ncbi:hypothetical protein BCR35DRAFT_299071 [Leucosporidium creatinivorum]|uniref:J domain-containing protein n=1 Tax=Leucosporidium creatinivorum TaxID=106004 RepID=A0A1Y2G310_9BASI|nr:hypothetical protein BCR35DRAFT_299071 [Leucosporidium creatinivorum]